MKTIDINIAHLSNVVSALETVSRGFRDAAESFKQFLAPFAALEELKTKPKPVQ